MICPGKIILGTAPVDSEPWPGEIHGLAIYSKELTQGEVLAHYQGWVQADPSGTSDLSNSMARYPFSERLGREIHNQVSNGTDLEIPRSFQVPNKAFLALPWDEFTWSRSYFEDVLRTLIPTAAGPGAAAPGAAWGRRPPVSGQRHSLRE